MKNYKNKRVTEPRLIDITCDICGNSCRDDIDMNYEMVTLDGTWGYGSSKDRTAWHCDICESCADKVKQFIESIGGKIVVTSYW